MIRSLTDSSSQDESKRTALAILNMFDDGVVHLIEGVDIDRTCNAITLTMEFHQLFGRFKVYFEP
jgi:HNH endonuclease